jgi:hypothetical protein
MQESLAELGGRDPSELASMVALVRSQVDVSLSGLLDGGVPPEDRAAR